MDKQINNFNSLLNNMSNKFIKLIKIKSTVKLFNLFKNKMIREISNIN